MSRPVVLPSGRGVNPRHIKTVSEVRTYEGSATWTVEIQIEDSDPYSEGRGRPEEMVELRDSIIEAWREASLA